MALSLSKGRVRGRTDRRGAGDTMDIARLEGEGWGEGEIQTEPLPSIPLTFLLKALLSIGHRIEQRARKKGGAVWARFEARHSSHRAFNEKT